MGSGRREGEKRATQNLVLEMFIPESERDERAQEQDDDDEYFLEA